MATSATPARWRPTDSGDLTLTNAVSGAGALHQIGTGVTSINTVNTYTGGTTLAAGTLAIGNGGALGTGALTVTNGELLGTASETLANALTFSTFGNSATFAAAPSTTLTLTGALTLAGKNTIDIGASGQGGNILWESTPAKAQAGDEFDVLGGVLAAGGSELGATLSLISGTTVEAGATLDWAGNVGAIQGLTGSGTVTDSGAAQTMTLSGATSFSGVISGALSLAASGPIILTGANTYTGTTTIHSGDSLQLGSGGVTGSIAGGDIIDAGALTIDRSDDVTLTNAVSGAGALHQIGTGVTSINTANTYTGGTTLAAGTLAIGNGGALGTGALTFASGELLATATATVANGINLSTSGSTTTIVAAPDTTLTLSGALKLAGNNTVDLGAPGQDGKIVWKSAPVGTPTGDEVDVLGGTLTAGGSQLGAALGIFSGTTVAAGATLDWAGNVGAIQGLQGAGTVTNSGAAQTMTLSGVTNFSGTISGALSLAFNGNATLSGLEDASGSTTLTGPITVTNSGTYDIVAGKNIVGTSASSFINSGVFEKTGGVGVSDVSSNFVNNGTLNVESGSVEFSGGFTNNGLIDGLVTQSGGVTTISAPAPSDFNTDGFSDILFQDGSTGQVSISEMNGPTVIGGGAVSLNPGPSWQAVGSADFNGDGQADILWQNANGQAAIWEMDGANVTASATVGPNPGPNWKVVGTGDFNGDGNSDILWQNASGQVAVWEMDGTNVIAGGSQLVGPNPGPNWKVVGTGDFNGDGNSDILLQNTDGQAAIWEMDGTNVIASATVGANPGPNWKVVGTGDFNGDGNSDILLQNTDGQAAIWEMDGTNVIASATVGANPGPNWKAVGTGDFNGDGFSDILWQNASGQTAIWEMDGTKPIAGGSQLVASNLGSAWHAIGA